MPNEPSQKHIQWASLLDSETTQRQVDALRQMSRESTVTGFTVSIVRLAGSRDDDVRMWSAEVLESTIQPHASEVEALVELMTTSEDGEICYWTATMLGRLGANAAAAVQTLTTCIGKSMYLPARERATWALSQIGPHASDAIPALKEVSQTSPPRLQRLAIEAISRISRDDEAAA